MSTATAQPSQPAFMLPFEDASSPNSSVSEETGSKETAIAFEICPIPECETKCGRFQELVRHICERHLPPHIYCGQLDCDWTGNRRYALQSHLTGNHPGISMSQPEGFIIYDAKGLAKQLRTKQITVEQAVHEACSLFKGKARQMGKLGIWHWMTGL